MSLFIVIHQHQEGKSVEAVEAEHKSEAYEKVENNAENTMIFSHGEINCLLEVLHTSVGWYLASGSLLRI